ncbi:MAG: sulfite exporter TauE/SafE family protein [Rhodobacteraceae bacterium]|nr:sulfite exporter TauE/SafE family protein [Paracoccaceae bacterium]
MTDLASLLPMLATLLAVGAVAGLIAGLLGVGGGIVLVPAFFYVFDAMGYGGPGLMRVCLATSLATIIVTSARSVHSHHRKGAVEWQILRQWAPGIAVGAVLGVLVVAQLRTPTLQAIFGGLAFAVALYMAFGRIDWRLGDRMPGFGIRAAVSPVIGFLSVLMGIGGGSFGVPLMTLHGVPIHRAVATAAGFGFTIALPSVAAFLMVPVTGAPPFTLGAVNLPAFIIVISMTLVTAPWGASLAHRLNPKPLKRIFAAFLAVVALNMLRKALGA